MADKLIEVCCHRYGISAAHRPSDRRDERGGCDGAGTVCEVSPTTSTGLLQPAALRADDSRVSPWLVRSRSLLCQHDELSRLDVKA